MTGQTAPAVRNGQGRVGRGMVAGLEVANPLGELLPAVYQEDDPFIMQFTAALDDVLAPVIATLDCLDAYLDPWLAPPDFVVWLAGWVGMELDEEVAAHRHRAAVATAVQLHRMRGTRAGLRRHLELLTGGQVEIADSGGIAYSTTPGADLPGEDTPRLAVRVAGARDVSAGLVDVVVAANKPAHIVHRVEVRR